MQDIELIFVGYRDVERAEQVLDALKEMEDEDHLRLFNAAVIHKNKQGKTHVKEMRDIDAGHGALAGAIFGGLIGLFGGPAGVVVGAALGSAAGGVAARKIDMGFSDKFLDEIKDSLKPSSSALLLIAELDWTEPLIVALKPFQGKIVRHALRADLVSQIIAAQEEGD